MKARALLMLKVCRLFDAALECDQQAVAREVWLTYGGPETDDAEMLLALRRQSDRERQARVRFESREPPNGQSRDGPESSRDGEGDTDPNSSRSLSRTTFEEEEKPAIKKRPKALDDKALSKAHGLLSPDDYAFLSSCPEPFRTEWLIDPEWWVSLLDGYPKVAHAREASKCMAYVQGKFSFKQMARLNLRERLRRWCAKADYYRERNEERRVR